MVIRALTSGSLFSQCTGGKGSSMGAFILRRILFMVPTLIVISIISFIIIELPPGDHLTSISPASPRPATVSTRRRSKRCANVTGSTSRSIFNTCAGHERAARPVWLLLPLARAVAELIVERLPLRSLSPSPSLLFAWSVALRSASSQP